jgi:hypothetical protein
MTNDDHKELTIQHEQILKKHDLVISDHEKRVRWLEKAVFYALGGAFVAKFVWDFYMKITTGKN